MFSKLTSRESEILKLIAEGKSNKDISKNLSISESTVENHIHNIYRKLGIVNRAQAVAHAYQIGMVLVDNSDEKQRESFIVKGKFTS